MFMQMLPLSAELCLQAVGTRNYDVHGGKTAEDALLECVKRDAGLPRNVSFQRTSSSVVDR